MNAVRGSSPLNSTGAALSGYNRGVGSPTSPLESLGYRPTGRTPDSDSVNLGSNPSTPAGSQDPRSLTVPPGVGDKVATTFCGRNVALGAVVQLAGRETGSLAIGVQLPAAPPRLPAAVGGGKVPYPPQRGLG